MALRQKTDTIGSVRVYDVVVCRGGANDNQQVEYKFISIPEKHKSSLILKFWPQNL